MKRHNKNVRDLRGSKEQSEDQRNAETLRYGKAAQSPMVEGVGNINMRKGAGDDTDTQGLPNRAVPPKNQRAADINGVEWRGE